MKKTFVLLVILLIPLIINAQDSKHFKKRKEVLREKGLTRSSLDYTIFAVLERYESTAFSGETYTNWSKGGGFAFRFSSNWYLTPNFKTHRIYFRSNWIRFGGAFYDGVLFSSAPLNIGLGDNIRINENINLDFSFSGGLVIAGPGILYNHIEPVFAMYPEVILQIKHVGLGLTYSFHDDGGASPYHFVGLMIVHRLGR